MKSKKRNPPRPVPVLTPQQEALLTAIADSKQFTLDAALVRAAGAVRLRPLIDADTAIPSNLEPNDASET